MSMLHINNPLIEDYLVRFDSLNPEEQQAVFTKLIQKRIVADVAIYDDQRVASVNIGSKTPEQDFLDFCDELAMPAWSDEDVERMKHERLKERYS